MVEVGGGDDEIDHIPHGSTLGGVFVHIWLLVEAKMMENEVLNSVMDQNVNHGQSLHGIGFSVECVAQCVICAHQEYGLELLFVQLYPYPPHQNLLVELRDVKVTALVKAKE